MKQTFVVILALAMLGCTSKTYNDGFVQYEPLKLTDVQKSVLSSALQKSDMAGKYDASEKMTFRIINSWQYHIDSPIGTKVHDVRSSFKYAVQLLDMGGVENEQQAFDILARTISLQDQDTTSPSCGVWPYFKEEPLATKKSPIDYNWADFNAVKLLDIWMGHNDKLVDPLRGEVKNSLILAAKAIQKRDVGPDYTNIAIMGTYVTYLVSHLFDMPKMQEYAANRLKVFYDYTLDLGGFSEYNSPTYTVVALEEIARMQNHIVEPSAKQMIDSMYAIGWDMVARHFHKPTMQWAGPHSRSYHTLLPTSTKSVIAGASNGLVEVKDMEPHTEMRINHQIPTHLLPFFTSPQYPRVEVDVFDQKDPQVVGKAYLTDDYALSTCNMSSLWNQRRPMLTYWGTVSSPKSMQLRFLHDDYDFTSALLYTQQEKNDVLSCISFATNSGDKHPFIGKLKDGKFMAKDLRLRFEFGNVSESALVLPKEANAPVTFEAAGLIFQIQLLKSAFDDCKGHWEKGSSEQTSWLDFVVYSGDEKAFDLLTMNEAYLAFTYSVAPNKKDLHAFPGTVEIENGQVKATWEGMRVSANVKPSKLIKRFL